MVTEETIRRFKSLFSVQVLNLCSIYKQDREHKRLQKLCPSAQASTTDTFVEQISYSAQQVIPSEDLLTRSIVFMHHAAKT